MRFIAGTAGLVLALTACSGPRLSAPVERRALPAETEPAVVMAAPRPGTVEPDPSAIARRFGPLLSLELDVGAESVAEVVVTGERRRPTAAPPPRPPDSVDPAPSVEDSAEVLASEVKTRRRAETEREVGQVEIRFPAAEAVISGPRAELWLDVVLYNSGGRSLSPAPSWRRPEDACFISAPGPLHAPARSRKGPPGGPLRGPEGAPAPETLPSIPPGRSRRLRCRRGYWLAPAGDQLRLDVSLPRLQRGQKWFVRSWVDGGKTWRISNRWSRSVRLSAPRASLRVLGRAGWALTAAELPSTSKVPMPAEGARVLVVDRTSPRALHAARGVIESWGLQQVRRFGVLLVDVEAAWWREAGLHPASERLRGELLEDLARLRPEGTFSLAAADRALKRARGWLPSEVSWVAPSTSRWAGRRSDLTDILDQRQVTAPAEGPGAGMANVWRWPDADLRRAPPLGIFEVQRGASRKGRRFRIGARRDPRVSRSSLAGPGFRARAAAAVGLSRVPSKPRLQELEPELRAGLEDGRRRQGGLPVRLISRPAARSSRRQALERTALRSESPLLWLELARARATDGDTAGAARALSALVAAAVEGPEDAERRRLAGYALLALGLPRLAAELFAGLAADEGGARALVEYGLALEQAGRLREAAEAYEESLRAADSESSEAAARDFYARILATSTNPAARSRRAELGAPLSPLSVSLWWSRGVDLDLWVLEPDGHRAEPGAGVSPLGGRHPWNVVDGAAPEAYGGHATGRYDVLVRAASGPPYEVPAGALVVSDVGERRELTSRWIPAPEVVSSVVSAVVGGGRPEVTSILPGARSGQPPSR
ncbi:MAG: hypothetical protein AAFZ18_26060 [Myxococcota bacterium]